MAFDGFAQRAARISLRGIEKSFGPRAILRGIDFECRPGTFVAVVGRSGCGKSTLLRLLAGLESPDLGEVRIERGDHGQARRSDVRLMFQDPRLLPWKRVLENVALGTSKRGMRAQATGMLQKVGLDDRARDWPAVLSGGQRQRVALARALLHSPALLLLDEPFSALDALTRLEMQRLVESLWREQGFTALLVTHDVAEAIALADRVLLIEEGRIVLDLDVPLARPRRIDAQFAAIERAILDRLLRD
jgi:sulfonate transport system ATP-binding protein